MPIEIEKKFLLADASWRCAVAKSVLLRQGYLSRDKNCTVRVRISGEHAWCCIKGANTGAVRQEYEYAIPREDADAILTTLAARPLIEKTRHYIPMGPFTWEIDEFHGENAGLIVAEIELPSENMPFEKPAWIGREVTHEARYYNSNLSSSPYTTWPQAER